jgi:hypothetical protein
MHKSAAGLPPMLNGVGESDRECDTVVPIGMDIDMETDRL